MKIIRITYLLMYFVLGSFLCYAQEGTVKWSDGGFVDELRRNPSIGFDENIIFTGESNLYVYHPDSTQYWEIEAGSGTDPVIGTDSTIYVGEGYNIYAYNPDSTLKWAKTVYNDPEQGAIKFALGSDGTIYVGAGDSTIRAFDTQGNQKWEITTIRSTIIAFALNHKMGTIYASSYTAYTYPIDTTTFYAINTDGTIAWQVSTTGYFGDGIAIDFTGLIYVGHSYGKLYCLYPNGTIKWTYQAGTTINASPVIGTDGTIYVGSEDNYFYAINPDGTLKWRYLTGNIIEGGATIGNDSVIYFGSADGYIYALNPNGTLRWKYLTSGIASAVMTSPVIDSSGTLYVGSTGHVFYAIYCSSTGLANSSWPKYGHDNQNTCLSSLPLTSTPLFPDELFP